MKSLPHGISMERRKHKMKLEEALRKAIMRSGAEVFGEKRLLFILSDFRAFDDSNFPVPK